MLTIDSAKSRSNVSWTYLGLQYALCRKRPVADTLEKTVQRRENLEAGDSKPKIVYAGTGRSLACSRG